MGIMGFLYGVLDKSDEGLSGSWITQSGICQAHLGCVQLVDNCFKQGQLVELPPDFLYWMKKH